MNPEYRSTVSPLPSPENRQPCQIPDERFIEWLENELLEYFEFNRLDQYKGDFFYQFSWSQGRVAILLELLARFGKFYTHDEMASIMRIRKSPRLETLKSYVEYMEALAGPQESSFITQEKTNAT